MHYSGVSVFAAPQADASGLFCGTFNPAKVFYGRYRDPCFWAELSAHWPLVLIFPSCFCPWGIIYIIEILSVVPQVTYFKATHGKRLFQKCHPYIIISRCGWSEIKICMVFGAVSAAGGILALLCVIFGVI